MIAVIAQFKLPQTITRERAREAFLGAAPKYKGFPGLIRKYYILSQDGGRAGGIYLWKSREDADRLYTEEWKDFVREKYGAPPLACPPFQGPQTERVLERTITFDIWH